ncbi:hypothetical protein Pla52n_09410 [Stieleria varia]|uniref:Uncharacterized protein n=1 Tax=Stieleria varia TaxID=2528005 RepID=A0A5C6BAQ4_9BACT|nr:hypothetical protein Pla52n_09410 [Stieleria varia]
MNPRHSTLLDSQTSVKEWLTEVFYSFDDAQSLHQDAILKL